RRRGGRMGYADVATFRGLFVGMLVNVQEGESNRGDNKEAGADCHKQSRPRTPRLTIHSHELVRTIVARDDCVKCKVAGHSSYAVVDIFPIQLLNEAHEDETWQSLQTSTHPPHHRRVVRTLVGNGPCRRGADDRLAA